MSSKTKRRKKLTRKGRPSGRKEVSLAIGMPERGDMGPDTTAQRAGRVIEAADWVDPETGERKNPNNVRRARRIDLVESYYRRSSNPLINERQFRAAVALRNAFEATQRTPPAIKAIQVDSSPKPDANVAMMIERQSKYHAIAKHVPKESAAVIDMVVICGHSIGHHRDYRNRNHANGVALLRLGLTAVANGLGL